MSWRRRRTGDRPVMTSWSTLEACGPRKGSFRKGRDPSSIAAYIIDSSALVPLAVNRSPISCQRVDGSRLPALVLSDCGFLLQDITHLVEALEQTVFRKCVDWELDRTAVRKGQALRSEINLDRCARRGQ